MHPVFGSFSDGSNKDSTKLKPTHILHADQFNRDYLENLYHLTNTIRKFDKSKEGLLYLRSLLPHKRAMLYFTQPSTRTFLSFQSACYVLGMQPCEIRDTSTSSERKGESVEDSIRTFSSYVDLIIMRSPIAGLCDRIASLLDETPRPVPIINGGSGSDQHPTQALLDIYTLKRSFKDHNGIDGKTICMVGDLKRGRTIRSLSRLLLNYNNVKMIFVSPEEFKIADDLRNMLKKSKVSFEETTDFNAAIKESDAIYMTRVQDEHDVAGESKKIDITKYHLKYDHLKTLRPHCVIMHPLPRREEIDVAVDQDPRAKYWRQERNGMWVRVALITKIFGVDNKILLPDL